MGEVVILGGETRLPIPVERVLEGAKDLEYVLVLGLDSEGNFISATSEGNLQRALWFATKFIHKCHNGDFY